MYFKYKVVYYVKNWCAKRVLLVIEVHFFTESGQLEGGEQTAWAGGEKPEMTDGGETPFPQGACRIFLRGMEAYTDNFWTRLWLLYIFKTICKVWS